MVFEIKSSNTNEMFTIPSRRLAKTESKIKVEAKQKTQQILNWFLMKAKSLLRSYFMKFFFLKFFLFRQKTTHLIGGNLYLAALLTNVANL